MDSIIPKTKADLSLNNLDFLNKTTAQVKKEFLNFNWTVLDGDFSDGNIDRIIKYLRYDIDDFYAENETLFNHFLYRVDISQAQIQQYTQLHIFEDVYECIAELILLRCAQKVYYQQKFSV